MTRFFLCFALFLGSGLAVSATAQDRELPYWATIDAEEVNMRVGPSRDYPIEWVYKREGLPVKVVRVREGWRLVQDPDGAQGWVVSSLLSAQRGALVIGEGLAAMREGPADNTALRWNAEPGVVGKLGKCESGYCEFDVAGRKGWVETARLWGAGAP